MMRIVSWNCNSVRLRLPLVEKIAQELSPDILCLQETKVHDDHFPLLALQAMGFTHCLFRGGKSYNGVAILSRIPLEAIAPENFGGQGDARHIAAALPCGTHIHNLYIPAGGDEPDVTVNPKFAHKLQFVRDVTEWGKQQSATAPIIMLGDFNIAPLPEDVWSHKQLLSVVSHTPIEVELLTQMQASTHWRDVARIVTPAPEKLFSWWSYRNQDWRKSDRGRRLDHIWVTPALEERIGRCFMVKDARDWPTPSDHVPVVMELNG